ncbi:MAG: Holliday junction branch migration DNA helicase RuvB [Pseudomonadota bacterium]
MSQDAPRIMTPHPTEEDHSEHALRPQTLADFTGQAGACQNLKIFIESAKARSASLDHILLYGPPGLGKTTLSQIVAKELGVNFKASSGPLITKAGDLAAILTNLQANDVLFIDEIHRMNPSVEEILYPAMEDFQLDLIIGEGPAARTVRIDLQPFTLVGATTRAGLVSQPLRDRFGIPTRLVYYTDEELIKIVNRAASLMQLNILEEGALEIAKRSRGTPRIAGRLLRRVRDFAIVEGHDAITLDMADYALSRLEVDKIGLDSNDRRYLNLIAEAFAGGPVGIETLAAALSEARDAIEDIIEPFLIQKGFLNRTPRGRVMTRLAWQHLGKSAPIIETDLFENAKNSCEESV